MMKKDKTIPKFKNKDEEREFWATHSPLDYFDTKDCNFSISPGKSYFATI